MKENMVWKAERAEHAPTVELGIYYESGEPEKRLIFQRTESMPGAGRSSYGRGLRRNRRKNRAFLENGRYRTDHNVIVG